MIRIERDPAWWAQIAADPDVERAMMGVTPEKIGQMAQLPNVLPLAAEHGGFLFERADVLGFTCDMHALFTRRGWGFEAAAAGSAAIRAVWICGFQEIRVFEVESLPRTRPPERAGFLPAGNWKDTAYGPFRLWTLTKTAWDAASMEHRSCLLQ